MESDPARKRAFALPTLQRWLSGVQMLAFMPALALGAFWIGGELALIIVALCVPILSAMSGALQIATPRRPAPARSDVDRIDLAEAESRCGDLLEEAQLSSLSAAALAVELGGLDDVAGALGEHEAEILRKAVLERMRTNLRNGDFAVRIGDRRFLVLLEPKARLDLEQVMEVATRLQSLLETPVPGGQRTHYLTAAIGVCAATRLPRDAGGEALLDATLAALSEAVSTKASGIRAWSDGLGATRSIRRVLREDVGKALESGQIQPWFQPQICTSTGAISGAEALARWVHPDRGVIPPADFLDALEAGGHLARLGEVMIRSSLAALNDWSSHGLDIPKVSVNLSGAELREKTLPDRIAWELDRQSVAGEHLCIEVLETAFSEDTGSQVSENVSRLKRLGCTVDLDDFGTGHASIMALHRLPIDRVKIDRSFIAGIDRNESQRRMVAGILSLAEQLGIETLAEGVESAGEHALLAQLGCGHVQGFRIARPMPAQPFANWIVRHNESIATPDLSRRAR